MADEFTTNYGLFLPKPQDSMADVEKNLTNSFEKLAPVADITVIAAGAALPQVGNYEVGDRVFRNDDPLAPGDSWPSSYILTSKDTNWGWYWRPVQHMIAPWVNVPVASISDTNWNFSTTPSLQISQDYYGNCHWRGSVTYNPGAGGIPVQSWSIFKIIPEGIRPNVDGKYPLAVSPVAAPNTGKYMGAILDIRSDGTSFVRTFGTANSVAKVIWFDGLVYNNSREIYYGP